MKEAKKILPKTEFEAFEAILMNQISRTPAAKLKQRATLARRLRDKYRDLAHGEARGVRTRRTNEVDTDINDRRVNLFQSLIDRLEEELGKPRFHAPKKSPATAGKAVRRTPKETSNHERRQLHEARHRER